METLAEEIVYAHKACNASPHNKPEVVLDVVYLHGRYFSFNNRRLYAFWRAADELNHKLRVMVNCHPLLESYAYAVAPEEDGGRQMCVPWSPPRGGSRRAFAAPHDSPRPRAARGHTLGRMGARACEQN